MASLSSGSSLEKDVWNVLATFKHPYPQILMMGLCASAIEDLLAYHMPIYQTAYHAGNLEAFRSFESYFP